MKTTTTTQKKKEMIYKLLLLQEKLGLINKAGRLKIVKLWNRKVNKGKIYNHRRI